MVKRNYDGCKPDPKDYRDYKFKAGVNTVAPVELPESVDLREYASEIEDQEETGSCCANAAASILEYYYNKLKKERKEFSRMFIYYNVRKMERTYGDDGASIRGTLKAIGKYGACSEDLWKFRVRKLFQKPAPECFTEGLEHQIKIYLRLYSVDDIKTCLAGEMPVILGIQLFDSFEGEQADETGFIPMPASGEKQLGGHAISIFGYFKKEGIEYFICKNSWGRNIHDNGWFYLPVEYVALYGADMWTVKLME